MSDTSLSRYSEALKALKEVEDAIFECTGTAFMAGESTAKASDRTVIYRKLCAAGNKVDWAHGELLELSSATVSEQGTLKDDVPLKCEVIDGAIQFVVGAKVLAHATNICPALYDAENDRGRYKVTDPAVFAKELAHTLNKESEDGSTRLSRMMDEAVEEAIDYGAEGVEENNDPRPAEREDS